MPQLTMMAVSTSTAPIVLSIIVSIAIVGAVIGAVYAFAGIYQQRENEGKFVGLAGLLSSSLLLTGVFGAVVGFGYHRGPLDALAGGELGLGLGFSRWIAALIETVRVQERIPRFLRGIPTVIYYLLPSLFVGAVYIVNVLLFVVLVGIPRFLLNIVGLKKAADTYEAVVTSEIITVPLFTFLLPYIGGTMASFAAKSVIASLVQPTSAYAATLGIVGAFGFLITASYFLLVQAVTDMKRPGRYRRQLMNVRMAYFFVFWMPFLGAWLDKRIKKLKQALHENDPVLQHEAHLSFAALLAGLATSLGFGPVAGFALGPASSLGGHAVISLETALPPAIAAAVIQFYARKHVEAELTADGFVVLVLSLIVLVVLALVH